MKINPYTWYGDRRLAYLPKHFIRCSAPLTNDSIEWVYENLSGRFYVGAPDDFSFLFEEIIYFEDSQEATVYELRWS